MSAAAEVLAELHALDLDVWADPTAGVVRLHERQPGALDLITPELRARVLAAKPELLRLLPTRRPTRPELNQGLAVREVLSLPAALLSELPVPTTLVLTLEGEANLITVATHEGCAPATFCEAEWLTLQLAAENERAFSPHVTAWAARKREAPDWPLTREEALGPMFGCVPRGWTVERVLRQLGTRLRAVVIGGDD